MDGICSIQCTKIIGELKIPNFPATFFFAPIPLSCGIWRKDWDNICNQRFITNDLLKVLPSSRLNTSQ